MWHGVATASVGQEVGRGAAGAHPIGPPHGVPHHQLIIDRNIPARGPQFPGIAAHGSQADGGGSGLPDYGKHPFSTAMFVMEVGFFAKDANRGMVQVQQNKLEDAAAVARVKAFWSVKLETLRSVLEK